MAIPKVNGAVQIAELADLGAEHAKTFDEAVEAVKGDEVLSIIVGSEKKEAAALVTATKKDKVVISLADVDSARDEAIMDAHALARAMKKLKAKAKREAAEKVTAVFDKYTGITRLSNANESGQIASLLEDLANPEAAAAVGSLEGMQDAVDDIAKAEAAFQDARHKSEEALAREGESASVVKKRLVSLINDKLVPYLSVVSAVKSDVYEDFAAKISVSITRLNATVNQRGKKTESQA